MRERNGGAAALAHDLDDVRQRFEQVLQFSVAIVSYPVSDCHITQRAIIPRYVGVIFPLRAFLPDYVYVLDV